MNSTNMVARWIGESAWLQQTLLGNQLWQYGLFFFYCLVAVLAAKVTDLMLANYLQRLADRTATRWDDRVLKLLHSPVRWLVFLFFMHLGLEVMNAPGWIQIYLRRGFAVLIAAAVTYVLMRTVDISFEIIRDRVQRRDGRLEVAILILLRKAIKIFVVVTAVIVTADNVGIKVTGLLASLGVTGLAVALASQETLSNLLGSIIILADRMFVVGDRIRIGADEGVVEYIGVRSTRLRTAEGDVIAIPNRSFTTLSVRNFSKTNEQLVASKSPT